MKNRQIKLTNASSEKIREEIIQAATDHLKAKDARTALSHFTEDATAVSNTTVFPSLGELAKDVNTYYDILQEVNLAVWDETLVHIINTDAALITAKFRYSFTDTNNKKTDLKGVWSALYVRRAGQWKIRMRHESFFEIDQ